MKINVHAIWLSEKDAKTLLVDVLHSHKPYQLNNSVDCLFTLKAEIAKRIKQWETQNINHNGQNKNKAALAVWLLLEAPLENVPEYIDEPELQEIILWRMNNNILPQNELRKQQELKRLKNTDKKRFICWDSQTGTPIYSP
jgi:hypothetical protein